MKEPLVTNAADRKQVRRAATKVSERSAQELDDLRVVMSTRPGRRLVRRWLGEHGLYESITVQSSLIYALSGRRDAGLEMLNEAVQHEDLYLEMEREAREDAKQQSAENAASRVARRTKDHE